MRDPLNPQFIMYILSEFVISFWSANYSKEARLMFLRVIPLFKDENEHEEFMKFIGVRGFTESSLLKHINEEALI